MSGKTWLAEFYPEIAREAAKRGIVAAGEHCLQKWLGFTPKALKKHQLHFDRFSILDHEDKEVIHAGPYHCAYCQLSEDISVGCEECPLANVASYCFAQSSPYQEFIDTYDPSRLIAALREALVWAQTREEEANSSPGA